MAFMDQWMKSDDNFWSKVGQFLESNQEDVKHFNMIENADEKKLFTYFDGTTPEKLQDQAWYLIIKMLGFRGREWVRQLNKSSLKSSTDSNGKKYFSLSHPMKTKTRKASLSRKENETIQC